MRLVKPPISLADEVGSNAADWADGDWRDGDTERSRDRLPGVLQPPWNELPPGNKASSVCLRCHPFVTMSARVESTALRCAARAPALRSSREIAGDEGSSVRFSARHACPVEGKRTGSRFRDRVQHGIRPQFDDAGRLPSAQRLLPRPRTTHRSSRTARSVHGGGCSPHGGTACTRRGRPMLASQSAAVSR